MAGLRARFYQREALRLRRLWRKDMPGYRNNVLKENIFFFIELDEGQGWKELGYAHGDYRDVFAEMVRLVDKYPGADFRIVKSVKTLEVVMEKRFL